MRGVQAGLGPACSREFSKTLFRYGLFEPFSDLLRSAFGVCENETTPMHLKLLAGGSSGMVAAAVCNPLDLIKVQLQSSGKAGARAYAYESGLQALRSLSATHGVASLWTKGVGVSIGRSMMSTSIMMTCLSTLRENGFSTAPASAIAAFFTIYGQAPFDTVRSRIYAGGKETLSPLAVARNIFLKEGVTGFYKGALINYVRYAPHAVLSFVLIDILQQTFL